MTDDGRSASATDQSENQASGTVRCAMAGCDDEASNPIKITRGENSWVDNYCDYHADIQVDLEPDAEYVGTDTKQGEKE